MKNWLIIADSEPLVKSQTQAFAHNKSIIALDGALSCVLDFGITPHVVIGDFDSVDPEQLSCVQKNTQIDCIFDPNQNTTDLEKALNYLCPSKPHSVTICHATGKRLDHTLYNLRLLKRFHGRLNQLKIVTSLEAIYFFSNQTIYLAADTKQPLALLAFPEAIIQSSGLEYELNNLKLQFGIQESTSNALSREKAVISIQGEVLLITSHATIITDS